MTVWKLHMQNADLVIRLKELKGGSTSRGGKKSKVSESDSRISQFVKHFGVMHEPFVPPSALLVEHPDMRSTDSSWYESKLSRVLWSTSERHASRDWVEFQISKHGLINHSLLLYDVILIISFKFTTQLNNGQQSLVYQLRLKTAHEIFGQPSKYYAVDFKREDIQDFQVKLNFPGQENSGYKKFAPILFPDGKWDFSKLFKCVELTKVNLFYYLLLLYISC